MNLKALYMDDMPAFPPRYVYRNGEQVTKENAEYAKGMPFHRCGLCTYYDDHKCKIVAGFIDPYMGCKYFMKKYEWDDSPVATVKIKG